MTHILRIPVVLFLALYLLPCGLLSRELQQADSTIVVLLGTGMPRPNPEASGPATAIIVGEQVFLFDAGPGVERQLSAAHLLRFQTETRTAPRRRRLAEVYARVPHFRY